MNMGGSELNPLLGRMDDEDCFGFHSEYYVIPDWRNEPVDNSNYYETYKYFRRGYTQYSKYQDDIYFVYFPFTCEDIYIIKSNVKRKTSCAVRLDTKKI